MRLSRLCLKGSILGRYFALRPVEALSLDLALGTRSDPDQIASAA